MRLYTNAGHAHIQPRPDHSDLSRVLSVGRYIDQEYRWTGIIVEIYDFHVEIHYTGVEPISTIKDMYNDAKQHKYSKGMKQLLGLNDPCIRVSGQLTAGDSPETLHALYKN